MIPLISNYFLCIIFLINIICVSSIILKSFNGYHTDYIINILAPKIKFILSLASFANLIYCFIISDFSVLLVAKYSSSINPLIYKITGSWGNHEGSMLLWSLELSTINFLFASCSKINKQEKTDILRIQAFIECLFIYFIINYSNPFEVIIHQKEGLGLNPALQDIGLAIHPPILYLGYILLSIPFSYSMNLLIKNIKNHDSISRMRIWICSSWIFLSLGIMLGSWWAYRELGWGGFWFWDPVENVSLMPWLICTGLIHTHIYVVKKNIFYNWFIFLSITGFCLSLFGSFLVRSGILVSVHSFASDPTRGIYLLLILSFISILSFLIFAIRINKFNDHNKISSYQNNILINNILLLTSALTILIGTLYPILSQFLGIKLSVGEGYFVKSFLPIMLLLVFFMFIATPSNIGKNINLKFTKFLEFFLSLLITIILSKYIGNFSVKYILFTSTGLALIISTINILLNSIVSRKKIKPMVIAHLSVGIIIFSITYNIYNSSEKSLYLGVGDEFTLGKYDIILKNIDYSAKDNYFIRKARFDIYQSKKKLTELYPEFRFYPIEDTTSYEADIYHSITDDLYVVIGEQNESKIGVRAYYKPMMSYLWVAVIIMVLPLMMNIFLYRN